MADADALLEVEDLQVHFPLRGSFGARLVGKDVGAVQAVDGVSFSVARGEVLGIVGESGSGKTTLGRALLAACATRPAARSGSRARTCWGCANARCARCGARCRWCSRTRTPR